MLESSGFNSDEHYIWYYKRGGFSPNICSWSILPRKVEIVWVIVMVMTLSWVYRPLLGWWVYLCLSPITWEKPWKVSNLPGAFFSSLASQPNWCALQPQNGWGTYLMTARSRIQTTIEKTRHSTRILYVPSCWEVLHMTLKSCTVSALYLPPRICCWNLFRVAHFVGEHVHALIHAMHRCYG